MNKYPKIQTIYKRDPANNLKTLLEGDFSLPELEYLSDNEWVGREKIDGTNIRVILDSGTLLFKGRSEEATIPSFLMDKLRQMFPVSKMLSVFGQSDTICLYGEGYGKGIQKAGESYIPNDVSFILFDIKIGHWWLRQEDTDDIAKKLSIDSVPILGTFTLKEAVDIARKGFKSLISDQIAEGLVLVPKVQLLDRAARRIITKIKCRDFKR